MRSEMNDLRQAMALRHETMTFGLTLGAKSGTLFARLVAAADTEVLSRAAMVLDSVGRLQIPLTLVLNRIETGQLRSERFDRMLARGDLDFQTGLKVKRTGLGVIVNGIRDVLAREPNGYQGAPTDRTVDGLAAVIGAAIPGAARPLVEPEPEPSNVLDLAF